MTPVPFRFDEIGYWSELKLEIVEKYGAAYTTAFKNNRLKKYYVDGLCGAGIHFSKKTATQVEGSPSRALKSSHHLMHTILSISTKRRPRTFKRSAATEAMCIYIQAIPLNI
jgi:three-Cys-motif partner protein